MSLLNYTDLQNSIAAWLHRDDLVAIIPDFIALAECRMDADIDSRMMESTYSETITGGTPNIALPDGLLELRRAKIITEPAITLKYMTPDQISQRYPNSLSGRPANFTVIGAEMILAPTPDADYTIEIVYEEKIPRLSNTNATNWLLTKHPNAYLFAALSEAHPYLINDARIPLWDAKYKEAVIGINCIDWYSGSTMTVKAM